jgi:GntR family transcriptional regulator
MSQLALTGAKVYLVRYTHKPAYTMTWSRMPQGTEGIKLVPEPAYVVIAGEYARRIRSGELPPGVQMPSNNDIAERHDVSNIVARRIIDLLEAQGLVRSRPRRGIFVADRPNLVRVSPERQRESPEDTFRNESDRDIHVDRISDQISATDELAEEFGVPVGATLNYVVTRVSEDRKPVSISDTYTPLGVTAVSDAVELEESLSDRLPSPSHATWLQTTPGSLVKVIRQRFFAHDGRLLMLSHVSYPRDRYDEFTFRMKFDPEPEAAGDSN